MAATDDTSARSPRDLPASPKRSLGQNFLVDPNIARKIVAALRIGPDDTILEIGPGRGALSEWIVKAGPGRFLAVEKDLALALALPRDHPGVAVVAQDALRLDWGRLAGLARLKIVGNLPYNVASPLVWDMCAGLRGFAFAVFMVQHEVARRMAASPGTKEYGALTAFLGNYVQVEYLFKVGPNVFRPRPKVDSAVVRLTPLARMPDVDDPGQLAWAIKHCFSNRRKQMRRTLRGQWSEDMGHLFERHGYSPECRAEDLSPDFFRILAKSLKKPGAS